MGDISGQQLTIVFLSGLLMLSAVRENEVHVETALIKFI
jgi:hypothetical protein